MCYYVDHIKAMSNCRYFRSLLNFMMITIVLIVCVYTFGRFCLYVGILNITVYNNSPTNTYVQKVTFNGKLIDLIHSPFIEHKELTLGGTLKFWMTSNTLQFS